MDKRTLKLLKQAADAAGIPYEIDKEGTLWTRRPWFPLTDDGDALRLAIKMRLVISPPTEYSNLVYVAYPGGGVCEDCKDDPCAATRKAIVRAAARSKAKPNRRWIENNFYSLKT